MNSKKSTWTHAIYRLWFFPNLLSIKVNHSITQGSGQPHFVWSCIVGQPLIDAISNAGPFWTSVDTHYPQKRAYLIYFYNWKMNSFRQSPFTVLSAVDHCFSVFNVCTNQSLLAECSFWFSRSGGAWESAFLTSRTHWSSKALDLQSSLSPAQQAGFLARPYVESKSLS